MIKKSGPIYECPKCVLQHRARVVLHQDRAAEAARRLKHCRCSSSAARTSPAKAAHGSGSMRTTTSSKASATSGASRSSSPAGSPTAMPPRSMRPRRRSRPSMRVGRGRAAEPVAAAGRGEAWRRRHHAGVAANCRFTVAAGGGAASSRWIRPVRSSDFTGLLSCMQLVGAMFCEVMVEMSPVMMTAGISR
jgi:hypothetical protein